jgi:hypothetical protein
MITKTLRPVRTQSLRDHEVGPRRRTTASGNSLFARLARLLRTTLCRPGQLSPARPTQALPCGQKVGGSHSRAFNSAIRPLITPTARDGSGSHCSAQQKYDQHNDENDDYRPDADIHQPSPLRAMPRAAVACQFAAIWAAPPCRASLGKAWQLSRGPLTTRPIPAQTAGSLVRQAQPAMARSLQAPRNFIRREPC